MFLNEKVKSDIIDAKAQHDAIIDELLISTVLAQVIIVIQIKNIQFLCA